MKKILSVISVALAVLCFLQIPNIALFASAWGVDFLQGHSKLLPSVFAVAGVAIGYLLVVIGRYGVKSVSVDVIKAEAKFYGIIINALIAAWAIITVLFFS